MLTGTAIAANRAPVLTHNHPELFMSRISEVTTRNINATVPNDPLGTAVQTVEESAQGHSDVRSGQLLVGTVEDGDFAVWGVHRDGRCKNERPET